MLRRRKAGELVIVLWIARFSDRLRGGLAGCMEAGRRLDKDNPAVRFFFQLCNYLSKRLQ